MSVWKRARMSGVGVGVGVEVLGGDERDAKNTERERGEGERVQTRP